MRTFTDPAAEFVLTSRSIFGDVRVLDGSRAVLAGNVKLALEAGERELWVIEMRGPLEHRLAMVEVKGDIVRALREAWEVLRG
jgi:hypothetical protein